MTTSADLAFVSANTFTGTQTFTQSSRGATTLAIRLATLDSDFPGADWGFVTLGNPGSNGETRYDNQLVFGYNVGPSGRLNTSEHEYGISLESRYKTGAGIIQFEHYHFYQKADGTDGGRPFSITIDLTSHAINMGLRAGTIAIGDIGTANDWLNLNSTSSSGSVALSGNSTLAYTGSVTDWISQGGSALLGYVAGGGDTGRLFSGALTAQFFGNQNAAGSVATLILGDTSLASKNRGLRWNNAVGWQFQTGDSTWQAMGLPSGYYFANDGFTEPHVGIGPISYTPTSNATLEVYDARASGHSAATQLLIRLADAGSQNQNPLQIVGNNGSTILFKVDIAGHPFTDGYRLTSGAAAMQDYFDAVNVFAVGTGTQFGFSSTANWFGTVDLAVRRNATGVLEGNTGASGAYAIQVWKEYRVAPSSTNGQSTNIKTLTELTTIAASATTDTAIQMPANAIVLSVSVRVTTAVTCTATFTVGDAGNATRFSTAAVSKASTSTDPGTKAGAYYNATAASIRITPDTTPSDNTGRVRVTITYIEVTVPTS